MTTAKYDKLLLEHVQQSRSHDLDRELLRTAVALLERSAWGVKPYDGCHCVTCDIERFLKDEKLQLRKFGG